MIKTFIFCGGYGSRMNKGKPGPLKPLIKINNKSILQYIFNIYNKFGYKDFYLLGGYKINELIKFSKKFKNINITVINSGLGTSTAGRLLFIKKYLTPGENFFLTYGDSLANFKPKKALNFKKENNYIISSYVHTTSYGVLKTNKIHDLKKIYEKNFFFIINAGFYVLDSSIFKFIKFRKDSFEKNVLPRALKSKKKIKAINIKKWYPIDNIYDIECVKIILTKDKDYFYD
jgi:glucose-1-phosphate cytidylyltransferase